MTIMLKQNADCVMIINTDLRFVGKVLKNCMTLFLGKESDYINTVDIISGKKTLHPLFRELKDFIETKYSVHVYNFVLDEIPYDEHQKQKRLFIQVKGDTKVFYGRDRINYSERIQNIIRKHFISLTKEYKQFKGHAIDNLLVVYNNFDEEIKWKIEADIGEEFLRILAEKYHDQFWYFSERTLFFYTDSQLKNCTDLSKKSIEQDYYNLVKKHDTLNIYNRKDISLRFYSKESLDRNFQGNLYFYFH